MYRTYYALLLALIFPAFSFAQKEPISDTIVGDASRLNDVIVYANKFPELQRRVAQYTKVIKDKAALNFQANTGDVLINSGAVFVQKSQQGGSSPVIRGFEASRILLMVDGVRMNTAIFRAGHLQNIITVDNMMLDRLEVLYGPSSTLYGSDALGGVVNLYTRKPKLSTTDKTVVSGNATTRYATAIEEGRAHVDFNIGGKKWASLTSFTMSSFGSVTQGKQRQSKYPNFGQQKYIVRRVGNTDSAFINPNPDRQTPSGYNQTDFMQKVLFQPTENIQHSLNIQLSNSTNVPRYDRLTDLSGGLPAFAEWYYGPQVRSMLAYEFNADEMKGFIKELRINANFQDVQESRITRRFKNNNKDFRWEKVDVLGFTIDAKHYSGKNEIHFGAESYTNYVRSTAERINIATGVASRIATRYADGFNKMSYNAVFAQHTLKINNNWTLNDGLRVNAVRLDARFVDTAIMRFPFTRARQNNLAATGNLGLIYANDKDLRIAMLLSSGFRSPNIDDLSKVFDTRIGAVVVPNPDIKPEYTYNAEINLNKYGSKFSYGGSVFYTLFKDAIVVDNFKFNGQDSIIYSNVKSVVLAAQNKAKAYIYGFSLNAAYTIAKGTKIDAVGTYTYGRYQNKGITSPLDHIPPFYGRIGLKHEVKQLKLEAFALYNGWKRLKDYSNSGEDNLQYATADGMPSWYTINFTSALAITKKVEAQLLVENILDRNYRYFASGISAAGRNIALSLRVNF